VRSRIPNALTIGRIVLIPVYVWLITTCDGGRSWPAAIVFGVAGVTDQIDGYLARLWHVESPFGKIADPLADRRKPDPNEPGRRGLWMANQLCDLVQIRVRAAGTVVRLHMHRN